MGVIIFNNRSSADFGINVETMPDYETAEKDYEVIHVPGRNGDLIIDKGSYKNTTRNYNVSVGSVDKDFTSMANNISEWLQTASGYARLEDSYEPEYYRMAMYMDSGVVENVLGLAGRTVISFNCKPQRFLKSGDDTITFTSSGTILNQTQFSSLPVIKVCGTGQGTVQIGGFTVSLSDINDYVIIDSEIQDVYKGTANKNSTATFQNGQFPKLNPGENIISFTGGITSVEVIPKWWTL